MLLIVAITVSGCRKEKSVLPCNNNTEPCVGNCLNDVDIATLTFGYVPDYYGIHYVSPFYNPLNNDEFVYVMLNYDLVSGSLNVYNIVTGVKTELWNSSTFSGGLIGQPKWTDQIGSYLEDQT